MKAWTAALILFLAFAGLGIAVAPEPPPAFDVEASQAIQAACASDPVGVALEATSDLLHAPRNLLFGVVFAMLVFARVGTVRAAVFVLACTFLTPVVVHGAKSLYGRARPSPDVVAGGMATSTKSYPSGHVGWTAAALGSLAVLGTRRRRGTRAWLLWIAASCGAGWVALSRVYLGRHYVTDTIGAALLAAAVVVLCAHAVLRAERVHSRGL